MADDFKIDLEFIGIYDVANQVFESQIAFDFEVTTHVLNSIFVPLWFNEYFNRTVQEMLVELFGVDAAHSILGALIQLNGCQFWRNLFI